MRIGLGTLFLVPGKLGGLENYARGLIKGFGKIDSSNEYFILANQENYKTWINLPENVKVHLCPLNGSNKPKRILYERYFLRKVLNDLKIDVYHSLAFGFPPKEDTYKTVITIGDIIFQRFPEDLGWIQQKVMDISVKYSCKNAGRILTFSEFSKKDLVDVYRVNPQKVDVALLSNSEFTENEEEVKKYFSENKIPKNYIFSVVSTYYHKNLMRLLEAFSVLKKEKNIPHSLIITGLKMAGHNEFQKKVEKYKLSGDVSFTGWISESVLKGLYSKTDCFVYPSLYEGFGLPVLEAMDAGVPVVCSNTTSLPEVYGDAAFTFDPLNIQEMVEQIYKCVADEDLKKSMIDKGNIQAKKFSWEKTAELTLKSYEKVIHFS